MARLFSPLSSWIDRHVWVRLFGWLVVLISLSPYAWGQPISDFDRSDLQSKASAVLRAYGTRDLEALKTLSTSFNRAIFDEMIAQGETHPRYRSIFLDWRMDAVRNWDGKLGEPRLSGKRARVPFAQGGPDIDYVVVLEREGGAWAFEDINRTKKLDSFGK